MTTEWEYRMFIWHKPTESLDVGHLHWSNVPHTYKYARQGCEQNLEKQAVISDQPVSHFLGTGEHIQPRNYGRSQVRVYSTF